MCVAGYTIVGLALLLFVQANNVYPQLLLARLFFSIGGAATATMVTAILPSMTAPAVKTEASTSSVHNVQVYGHNSSPSVSSELTITPERMQLPSAKSPSEQKSSAHSSSPTRLAGLVGVFTGLGALLALGIFLPLPTWFQKLQIGPGPAIVYTYYTVGAVALLVAVFCFLGLRHLKGEEGKNWRAIMGSNKRPEIDPTGTPHFAYWKLLLESLRLGFSHSLIGLGYLGGFVARASSVGISLFIPLYVNQYFINSGICKVDHTNDPADIKFRCREAYILAAQLTGTSQLVALLTAPVFGFLADRYRRFHIPLLIAALAGIVGYISFAALRSPESSGTHGNPGVFVIVSLLGVSQIGCIVCSLGLLGRGILGLEQRGNGPSWNTDREHRPGHVDQSGIYGEQYDHPIHDQSLSGVHDMEVPERTIETTSLLDKNLPKDQSLNHLKGSIAGVYSLGGGAGILLLTKLGGLLFDTKTPGAPFYMLAIFNSVLLAVGLLCGFAEFFGNRGSRQLRI